MEINYYDLLEVSPQASEEVIRAAFKVLQKRAHPDRGGDTRVSQIINLARDTMLDPERRRQYDALLAASRGESERQEREERDAPRVVLQTVEVRASYIVCMHCRALNRIAESRMERAPAGKCGKCGKRFAEPATVERDVFFAICLACGKRNLVSADDFHIIRALACRRCGAPLSGESGDYVAAQPAAPPPKKGRPALVRDYRLRRKGLELGMHLPGFAEGVWEVSDLFARMKGATLKLSGKLTYSGRRDASRIVIRVTLEEAAGMGSIATVAQECAARAGRPQGFALQFRVAAPDARRVKRLVLALER